MAPAVSHIPPGLLLFTLLSQMSILLVLLLLLLLQTTVRDRKGLRKKRTKDAYIEALGRCLTETAAPLPHPTSEMEVDALAEVCINVMHSIAGETADDVRRILTDAGVVDHYLRKSLSRSWLLRIYAIERLGLFTIDRLQGFFTERLATEAAYPVRIRLVWALSRVATTESLPLITRLLATEISISSKFNEYVYANIIAAYREKGQQLFFAHYLQQIQVDPEIPLSLKKDMIEASGSSELLEAAGPISSYFRCAGASAEMRISCIRAAGRLLAIRGAGRQEMRQELQQQVIVPGLTDRDWRIRAVAAGAAAAAPATAIPQLQDLLRDASYHVRINAGRALLASGTEGIRALTLELDSHDRFARETALYLLQPGGTR